MMDQYGDQRNAFKRDPSVEGEFNVYSLFGHLIIDPNGNLITWSFATVQVCCNLGHDQSTDYSVRSF